MSKLLVHFFFVFKQKVLSLLTLPDIGCWFTALGHTNNSKTMLRNKSRQMVTKCCCFYALKLHIQCVLSFCLLSSFYSNVYVLLCESVIPIVTLWERFERLLILK